MRMTAITQEFDYTLTNATRDTIVVDFRFTPPTPEGLGHYNTPDPHMKGYQDVYGKRVYGSSDPIPTRTVDELLSYLDNVGVNVAVLKTSDRETTFGRRYPPEKLAEYIAGHEDRLIPMVGIDVHKGSTAIKQLNSAVLDLGFKIVNIAPLEQKLVASDRRYYPIYAKCVELGVPIALHTSINYSRELLLDFGHPRHIDQVAVDFPDLEIICVHGGWPWVLDLVAVAWRHRNVYIDISGVRPKYLARPGTGWEPLMVYGGTVLQDQVLWGSNWPQFEPSEGIAAVAAYPLRNEVKDKWLGLNAARLLRLV